MVFTPELKADPVMFQLIEARNHQSHTLIEAAKSLLRQATETDLSNIATEILFRYPHAETIELIFDQRVGYEGVIFCGRIEDADGNKLEDSFNVKRFVDELLKHYTIADPASVVNRFINLSEYAEKQPNWF